VKLLGSCDLRILYRNLLTPIPLRRRCTSINRRAARAARPSRRPRNARRRGPPPRPCLALGSCAVRTEQATPGAEGGRAIPGTARARKHGSQAEQDVGLRTIPPPKRAPGRTRGGELYGTPTVPLRTFAHLATSAFRHAGEPKTLTSPRQHCADCAHRPRGTTVGRDAEVPTLTLAA
jgi:hypothetical protein